MRKGGRRIPPAPIWRSSDQLPPAIGRLLKATGEERYSGNAEACRVGYRCEVALIYFGLRIES
jgi:hypothetical protein